MVLVTAIIAAHNASETLAEALIALQQQTLTSWEAIVIDDGSTDTTAEVVKSFGEDARIRMIRISTQGGSGAARNLGIKQAAGRYIAVVDADDISLPERFELQVDRLECDPELAAVGGHVALFGSWGGPVLSRWPVEERELDDVRSRLRMPLAHCAAMFRTSDLREVGGYDETALRAQDFALVLKMSKRRMVGLDRTVVLYRKDSPTPLAYITRSGRYGRAVRYHHRTGRRVKFLGLPGSLIVDIKSIVQWAREQLISVL